MVDDKAPMNLIYRGSRDGFDTDDFLPKVRGIRNTLIMIKTEFD